MEGKKYVVFFRFFLFLAKNRFLVSAKLMKEKTKKKNKQINKDKLFHEFLLNISANYQKIKKLSLGRIRNCLGLSIIMQISITMRPTDFEIHHSRTHTTQTEQCLLLLLLDQMLPIADLYLFIFNFLNNFYSMQIKYTKVLY